ncbi:Ohr family peroxiredoxin [Enterococcus timonensis]|uniref:Ohr family peroxiredoxin n=1 Tax=Enterococcus timonensis TaxID=1852364 RepID=UPI0008DA418C|nr:Ohr family peroxiredoxin [Enterococcus timonensis]
MTEKISVATVVNTGGREGHSQSLTGELDVLTSATKKAGYTNPEELFAAGFSACFNSAMIYPLQKRDLEDLPRAIRCEVSLMGEPKSGNYELAVKLIGKIDTLSQEDTKQIMEETMEVCPYSKAVHGNIKVEIEAEEK